MVTSIKIGDLVAWSPNFKISNETGIVIGFEKSIELDRQIAIIVSFASGIEKKYLDMSTKDNLRNCPFITVTDGN